MRFGAPSGRPVEGDVLPRMLDAVAHRGPHGAATYADDDVALGIRLRAEDGPAGNHPSRAGGGSVLCIADGELYDHARSSLDVVPGLYERYGTAFPEHLRGKFALALWDGRNRRALLVRDRLGLKPLYYAVVGGQLVFASELKSVLASGLVSPELDYETIDAYLSLGYTPTPRTMLEHVRKLVPGSIVVADDGGVRVDRYWEFPKPEPRHGVDEHELAAQLRDALEDSVRLHLRGEEQAGAVLSGGLDSSFVVALLARNTPKPVKTFTVGFAEAGEHNEIPDAQFVSETFGCEHHQLQLSQRDPAVDLPTLVWHLDDPLADLSPLGLLGLSTLATTEVSAVFSGAGSDQLFGGYRKHAAASIAGVYKRIPGATAAVRAVPGRAIPGRFARAAQTLAARDPAARLLAMSGRGSTELRRSLARNELAALDGATGERTIRAKLNGVHDDPVAATLYLDAQLELVDDMLHYFDRVTMAHALEARIPFLDHQFVELTATIPSALKVKRLRNKHVLRLAAEGVLPQRVTSDKEKQKIGFFHSAVDSWFRAQVSGAVQQYLLSDELASAGFLDQAELQRVVRRYLAGGESENIYGLFAILMLEVWLSTYLPRALGQR
jgi:asparagine synthase (glutamine-hydrolysing)